MLNSDQRPKVTIEDLLRLKRAERPPAEFWSTFERELRQKQLTALLEKRSWWHGLPELITRRAYLPVGATAILAFTLVSLRYNSPVHIAQLERASGSPVVANSQNELPSIHSDSAPVSSPLVNRNDQAASRIDERTAVLGSTLSLPAETVGQAPATASPVTVESPSARSIAANLAHLEQSEPELLNAVLGSRLSSPARVQADSGPVVELASLSANGSKRSRLLASYNDRQVSPEPTAPDIVRERLSRRLGDTDYTERFSRIGLKGSQVSLKF